MDGPGQVTDPAFALPPSRDFDGGLLRRWSYSLTSADALAFLRLPRPQPRWQRLTLGAFALAWGATVGLLPTVLVGPWGSTRFVVLLLVGPVGAVFALVAGRAIWRRSQSRRMIPSPRPGQMEEWIDCIAVTRIDANEEDYLSPELIAGVQLTRRHLIVHGPNDPQLVPLSAFANQAEAVEVADHFRELAKGPYYFDP